MFRKCANRRETFVRRLSNFDWMLQITVVDTCFLNARSNDWWNINVWKIACPQYLKQRQQTPVCFTIEDLKIAKVSLSNTHTHIQTHTILMAISRKTGVWRLFWCEVLLAECNSWFIHSFIHYTNIIIVSWCQPAAINSGFTFSASTVTPGGVEVSPFASALRHKCLQHTQRKPNTNYSYWQAYLTCGELSVRNLAATGSILSESSVRTRSQPTFSTRRRIRCAAILRTWTLRCLHYINIIANGEHDIRAVYCQTRGFFNDVHSVVRTLEPAHV